MGKSDELSKCPTCGSYVVCNDVMVSSEQLAGALGVSCSTVWRWAHRNHAELDEGSFIEYADGMRTHRRWNLGIMRRWYMRRSAAGAGVAMRGNKNSKGSKPGPRPRRGNDVGTDDQWARGEVE